MMGNEDAYRQFAAYYDVEYAAFDDDISFYREFARQANGPILELGCGTGRVLAALEDLGLPLAGVDTSDAMLAIARSRLSDRVLLGEWDMQAVASCPALRNGPYFMAFSAINTFLHLPDVDAQLDTLRSLRTIVVEGGLLLLDLMVPEPRYLSDQDGRLTLEFAGPLPDGNRLDKWAVRTHDLALQTIETTVLFDVTDSSSGVVTRVTDYYATRYIHRFELEHLLHRAGWKVVSLYGSYELELYDSGSERMLVLATWSDDNSRGESAGWRQGN
ncbi:MAG TPA: class I SAM-dependent methyltransferase [Thermomicrobiales bacterium]|nr:class I SAM-dependent methyltransferase [Thermomicrobiales bacterium]